MAYLDPFKADIDAATARAKLSSKAYAQFQMFNPNGIRAEWSALSDRLVAFGRGYLAYGDTGYLERELYRLASYERKRVSPHEIAAVVSGIRRTIDRGNEFLAREGAAA